MLSARIGIPALLIVACLTSCAGGGGGGGGGGGSAPVDPPPSRAQLLSELAGGGSPVGTGSSLSEVLRPGPAAGLTAPDPTHNVNGFQLVYDYGPLGYSAPGNATMRVVGNTLQGTDAKGDVFVINPQDLTVFSNDLVGKIIYDSGVQAINTANTGIPNTAGTWRETTAMMLGGKAVGLEFTNFGFWEGRIALQGAFAGVNTDTEFSSNRPFILEAASAEKKAPSAGGTFNGKVLANAYERTDDYHSKAASLTGDARLSLYSAATGDIRFVFNNFYTLSTALTITGGAITNNGGISISDPARNTTGINLSDSGYAGSLNGQFYGGAGSPSATEAVGTFAYANSSNTKGVRGSFGVK